MLPELWGGNLSRVKDKPVAEPRVGPELGTDCAFTMSQSQKSVFLCVEDFGPTLLGPLLSGSVGHPIPSHLSSITNSGSKRPLDSRARVHIPVWAFHPCTGVQLPSSAPSFLLGTITVVLGFYEDSID